MKLVLFDIDGTILASGGAGEKALALAVHDLFGPESDLDGVEIAGRTDTAIARQLLQRENREVTPAAIDELMERYLSHLAEQLPRVHGRLLPGVKPLLDALAAREDILLGLLTGNLQRGAQLKLSQYGVWDYFTLGAFADDHHDRNELGPFARTRASAAHGRDIPCDRIYVLGDTPHDIACGRAIGARTVAVATGTPSKAELSACQPDYLFDDFSNTAEVLAIFDGAAL